MAKVRSGLVNGVELAEVAGEVDLGDHLVLGRGEHASGGHEKESILADAMEAVIAAIYLDQGLEGARRSFSGAGPTVSKQEWRRRGSVTTRRGFRRIWLGMDCGPATGLPIRGRTTTRSSRPRSKLMATSSGRAPDGRRRRPNRAPPSRLLRAGRLEDVRV